MLEKCLKGLIGQSVPENWQLEIGVVDNEVTKTAQATVQAVAEDSPIRIHYTHQPRRGIPFARNAALDLARQREWTWIALIDDDEVPSPDWLSQHLRTVHLCSAQVSYGAVVQVHDLPPPSWWKVDVPSADPEGTLLQRASTNNVLFSRDLIDEEKGALRFDEDLLHGYEDLDFFERAHSRNYRIVWAPKAVVTERVPASRSQPARLIEMVRCHAAAHAQVCRKRAGLVKALQKFGLKGLRRVLTGGPTSLATWVLWQAGLTGFEDRYFQARLRLARGVGNWRGIARGTSGYYDCIDGE